MLSLKDYCVQAACGSSIASEPKSASKADSILLTTQLTPWRSQLCVPKAIERNPATWSFNACNTRSACPMPSGAYWIRLTASVILPSTKASWTWMSNCLRTVLRVAREVEQRVRNRIAEAVSCQ